MHRIRIKIWVLLTCVRYKPLNTNYWKWKCVCVVKLLFLVALEESPVEVTFDFCSKILGGGGNLWMVLCHSMNADSVVWIPWGGGDTQTIPYAKAFVRTFFTHRWQGHKNFRCACAHHNLSLIHLVELPWPNFCHVNVSVKFWKVMFSQVSVSQSVWGSLPEGWRWYVWSQVPSWGMSGPRSHPDEWGGMPSPRFLLGWVYLVPGPFLGVGMSGTPLSRYTPGKVHPLERYTPSPGKYTAGRYIPLALTFSGGQQSGR